MVNNNKRLKPPSKENINRLVQQKKGDPSFLLVSLYSFIEGYIRDNFPDLKNTKILESDDEETKKKKRQKQLFITVLRTLYNEKTKKVRNQEIQNYREKHGLLYPSKIPKDEMNEIYDKVNEHFPDLHTLFFKEINTFHEYANDARHYFKDIDSGLVDTAITQFIEFSKQENFYNSKIKQLSDFKDWNNRNVPTENKEYNYLLNQINELMKKNTTNETLLTQKILELEKIEKQKEKLELQKIELETKKKKYSDRCDELRQKTFDLNQTINSLKKQAQTDASAQEQIKKLNEELDSVRAEKEKQENLLSEKQREIEDLYASNDSLSCFSSISIS